MKKPIVAVDIDDVLADNAGGLVAWSNARWGLDLTADHYDERWGVMWQTAHDAAETERRALEFHHSGVVGGYRHFEEAVPVLQRLARRFTLVIVTSRRSMLKPETHVWLDRHFPHVFSAVHFAGIYDSGSAGRHSATKTELCRKIGAKYLIDDQPKHCFDAARSGITALLFGDYAWNRDEQLPDGVVRVRDWAEVEKVLG